jgi:hypothetical protein
MPESPSTSNGTAVIAARQQPDVDRYRPKASTGAVYDEVIRSLSSVVTEAARTAADFVRLAEYYDRDKTTAIRHGHLVDAGECLEIAMTHLGQLRAAVAHRLRIEDEQNLGESPF